MTDSTKNVRVHIPREIYIELAHLAVDLPQATISSLIVEGAQLLLAKHGRQLSSAGRG
jgi:hypothetical protein